MAVKINLSQPALEALKRMRDEGQLPPWAALGGCCVTSAGEDGAPVTWSTAVAPGTVKDPGKNPGRRTRGSESGCQQPDSLYTFAETGLVLHLSLVRLLRRGASPFEDLTFEPLA